jgi:long-chain fatty acid transport protein
VKAVVVRSIKSFWLFFVVSQVVFAGGYEIAEQTTRSIALSTAITAGVDDPSAIYFNPAALTEVSGNQIMVGSSYINVISSVKNGGRNSTNIHDDDFLPSLFANYHIPNSNLVVGVGTYAPFGLATSYKDDSFTRFAAIRTQLKTLYITPGIAWSPSSILSVGGGFSFVHSSAALSQALFLGALNVGEGRLRITDTDDAFGYNLGILLKPHERLKFGITYRSRVDLDYDTVDAKFRDALASGGAAVKVGASGSHVPIPPVVILGLQWQITPRWTAEIDYKFVRWSEFEKFRVRFASPLPALGGAVPISALVIPQDWRDTSSIRFGTSYKLNENIELRGGTGFDQTPIPSKSLSPAIPGADFMPLNAGFVYTWKDLAVDFGYVAVFNKTRRVTNNVLEGTNVTAFAGGVPLPPLTPPGLAGRDKYETFLQLFSLQARYRF